MTSAGTLSLLGTVVCLLAIFLTDGYAGDEPLVVLIMFTPAMREVDRHFLK